MERETEPWYRSSMSSRALRVPPVGFEELSIVQQIEYVQSLWERIFAHEDEVPVPAWHREILTERLAEHDAEPDAGRPWEQVEADLRKRVASRR